MSTRRFSAWLFGAMVLGLLASITVLPAGGTTAEGLDRPASREVLPLQPLHKLPAMASRKTSITAVSREVASPSGIAIVGVSWPQPSGTSSRARPQYQVRTQAGGRWGQWEQLATQDDHGPDQASAEAKSARVGTEPFIINGAQKVQVRALAADPLPQTAVSVDDPGIRRSDRTLPTAKATGPTQPTIYSRASWGADESLRENLVEYGKVQAGFVHHTAGANTYTPEQVPGIIRGIYAYHVNGRGWRDIGYNYLADKYGRIWEGRYGGIDRPVIGAHTLGFNDDAFAMSALGNYDVTAPSSALLDAYTRLFAWKLALHGVPPMGSVTISGTNLQRINGHRDAGSTDCPGRYLYAKLPDLRLSVLARTGSPARDSVLRSLNTGTSPDIISTSGAGVSSGEALIGEFTRAPITFPTTLATGWTGLDLVTATADFTGDGRPDVLAREPGGRMRIYSGTATGISASYSVAGTGWDDVLRLIAPGDLDGDKHADLMAVMRDGRLRIFQGNGAGWISRFVDGSGDWRVFRAMAVTGDLSGDRRPDLVVIRDSDGQAFRFNGNGISRPSYSMSLGFGWAAMDALAGAGDLDGDGSPDFVVRERSTGRMRTYHTWKGAIGWRLFWGSGFDRMKTVSGGFDWDGDGYLDLISHSIDGVVQLYRGTGRREFDGIAATKTAPVGTDLAFVVGDLDKDGIAEVIGRRPGGELWLYPGSPAAANPRRIGTGWQVMNLLAAAGDLTGDSVPELLARDISGNLWAYPMTSTGGFAKRYLLGSGFSGMSSIVGVGSWDGPGPSDIIARVAGTGEVRLYPGTGLSPLASGRTLSSSSSTISRLVGAGDIDGDGYAELLAQLTDGYLAAWSPGPGGSLAPGRRLVTHSELRTRRAG